MNSVKKFNGLILFRVLLIVLMAVVVELSVPARAWADGLHSRLHFSIKPQPLDTALLAFANQSKVQILMWAGVTTNGASSPGAVGDYVALDALHAILENTGFDFKQIDPETIAIIPAGSPATGTPQSRDVSRSKYGGTNAANAAIAGSPQYSSAAAPDTSGLEEILVTAEKQTSTVQKTPLALSVFSGKALAEARVDTLQDLQQSVPNLVVTENTALAQPYIRGVGNEILASLNDSAVAVHLDGVYIPRGAALLFDFNDIDRVEVLRGPQGTLYGRNATGGAINVISKEPQSDPEGSLSLTYGNYNDRRVAASGTTALIPDTWTVRASVIGETRDGFQTNLYDGGRLDNKNVVATRLATKYQGEGWDVTIAGDYTRDASDGSGTREISGNPDLSPAISVGGISPPGFFDVNLNTPTRQLIENGGARITAHIGDESIGLTSITGYRSSHFWLILDQDGTQVPTLAGNPEIQNSRSVSQEFQLAGKSDSLKYVVGLYYFQEHALDDDTLVLGEPFLSEGLTGIHFYGEGNTNTYAAFGQATYTITPAWSVTLGGRFGDERKHATSNNSMNFIALPEVHKDLESNSFTPKFGVQYNFTEDTNAYVSATEGFKSGGINTISFGDEVYGPEKLWAYEVGLKSDWLDRRLRTNIDTFFYNYRNMQVSTYTGLGTLVQNAGFATIKGIEMEVQAEPIRNLHINGQISYLDGYFDKYITIDPDDPAAGVQDLRGYRLPRTPKYSYSTSAEYDYPLSNRFILDVQGEYQWRDSVYYSQYQNPLVGQSAFSLTNAFVSLKTSDNRYSVTAWGRNLGNTEWHAFVASSPGVTGIQATPAPPRTFGITLTVHF